MEKVIEQLVSISSKFIIASPTYGIWVHKRECGEYIGSGETMDKLWKVNPEIFFKDLDRQLGYFTIHLLKSYSIHHNPDFLPGNAELLFLLELLNAAPAEEIPKELWMKLYNVIPKRYVQV